MEKAGIIGSNSKTRTAELMEAGLNDLHGTLPFYINEFLIKLFPNTIAQINEKQKIKKTSELADKHIPHTANELDFSMDDAINILYSIDKEGLRKAEDKKEDEDSEDEGEDSEDEDKDSEDEKKKSSRNQVHQ